MWIPVRDFNHQLEKVVGYKVLQFIPHDEDQEDAWLQNSMVHIHNNFFKNDELGQNFDSSHNLLEQTFLNTCATCELFDSP